MSDLHPDLAFAEFQAEVNFQLRDEYERRLDLAFAKGPDYCSEGCRCSISWENVSMTRPPDLHLNGCPVHAVSP